MLHVEIWTLRSGARFLVLAPPGATAADLPGELRRSTVLGREPLGVAAAVVLAALNSGRPYPVRAGLAALDNQEGGE
jgi:hypothetical protein